MTTTCNTCGENLPAAANMSGMRWCPTCGLSSKYEPSGDLKRLSDAAKQLRRERDEARTKYLQITSSQSQFFRQSAGKGTEPWPQRFTQTTLSWHCKTCERPMSRTLKPDELKGPEAPKPSPEECDICRLEILHAELIRAMQGYSFWHHHGGDDSEK